MNLFSMLLLALLVVATSCNSEYRSIGQFSNSMDANVWKTDRCGMDNHRIKISLHIIKHKKIFIGIDSYRLTSTIGEPDFIENFSMFDYPNALFYTYSLSSIENINGKCGDPITKALSFAIDTNTSTVIGVMELIY